MRPPATASAWHDLVARRRHLLAALLVMAALTLVVSGQIGPHAEATRRPSSVNSESREEGVGHMSSSSVGGCTIPQFAEATASPIGAGDFPHSVAIGDFNGDGKLDLAVANYLSDNVTIRLGDGMGGFPDANASTVGAGDGPQAVAIGDFNRDGKLDLAVANQGSADVTIRLGDGTGGFPDANASAVGAGMNPVAIAIGDFNGDGKQDLAVVNQFSLTIRLGDGSGGFPTASTIGAGDGPTSIAVGDFNDDGKQDLAVANGGDDNVTIRLGDGMGGFPTASTVGAGNGPTSIAVGDFNRDGKQDLAVSNGLSDNVTIRLGDGMGGFPDANASTVSAGGDPVAIAIGDFNGDGKQDFGVANASSDNVTIQLNTCNAIPCGNTNFMQPAGSPIPVGSYPFPLAVGDFNQDGKQDLATGNFQSNTVRILLGDGMGGFTEATGSPVTVEVGPVSIAVGDFNRDGKQDLAVAETFSSKVTILLGDGMGGFTQATGSPINVGSSPYSIVAGDFNRDGKQDLAVANAGSDNVTILIGNGMGGFTQATGSPVTVGDNPLSVAVGDFNHDGKQDLATANPYSDNVTILIGDGMGGFTQATGSPITVGDYPTSLAVGDFNRDGEQDLAVTNRDAHTVTILLGNGMGGFTEATGSPVNVGATCMEVAVGDFNNDGKPDLATANSFADNVTILIGDGMGVFTEPSGSPFATGQSTFAVAVGDFNRDGKQDLATANHDSSSLTILLNTCTAEADLSISKTDLADPVMLGSKITYHITVTNNGPSGATGVVVTDHLPSSSSFVSATSSTGTCSHSGSATGGILTCQLGNLHNGASATVNVVVKSGGTPSTITNTASVRAANEPDSNVANNQVSETTHTVGFRKFSFSPPIVTGGCQNSVGTLLFTSPAPAGVTIKFPDSLAAIAPIPQVVTQGGETSLQVTAVTSNVNAEQLGTVTATTTAGPNSIQARLKLLPVKISSLTFSKNPVEGGEHITGTVMVTCAPSRDVTVRLTSDKAAARPDVSTVTIHAGQTSAQFGITTVAVPSARDVTFTATLNGFVQRATLHVIQ